MFAPLVHPTGAVLRVWNTNHDDQQGSIELYYTKYINKLMSSLLISLSNSSENWVMFEKFKHRKDRLVLRIARLDGCIEETFEHSRRDNLAGE